MQGSYILTENSAKTENKNRSKVFFPKPMLNYKPEARRQHKKEAKPRLQCCKGASCYITNHPKQKQQPNPNT